MGRFRYEFAAQVLVEAAYKGDRAAAKENGVSERSVRRWRNRMDDDQKLADLVQQKRKLAEEDWADELPEAIRAAIDYLRRAAGAADESDPEVIHAVAGALKMLSHVGMTKKVLDARLASRDR